MYIACFIIFSELIIYSGILNGIELDCMSKYNNEIKILIPTIYTLFSIIKDNKN